MDANIPLASNFFSNYFISMSFSLGGKEIERFTNPGVITDIISNLKESEYREKNGQISTFIPDQRTAAANDIPSSWTSGAQFVANTAQNQPANPAFNQGFKSRKELYNYTVANNATARTIELFIPLNTLFCECAENDRVLKFINFKVSLVINGEIAMPKCYYGANNTGIVFTGHNRGLTNIILELEIIQPRPEILLDLEKNLLKIFILLTFLDILML